MKKAIAQMLLRKALNLAGMWLVAHGTITTQSWTSLTPELEELIGGLVMLALGTLWSYVQTSKHEQAKKFLEAAGFGQPAHSVTQNTPQ